MGFVKKADRLSDFYLSRGQEGAELLKLTFENEQVLFLSGEGPLVQIGGFVQYYKVHPDFVPSQLQQAIASLPNGSHNEAFVGHEEATGYTVSICIGDSTGWEVECRTVSKLVSIEPCGYRDAYNTDLLLEEE